VWNPDPQVHGKPIWSKVSPNRASGPRLILTYHSQKTPKSLLGEWPETEKASGVIYFPLCAGEEDLLPLDSPHPFCLCVSIDVWQKGRMGGGQSKNTPPTQNFKRVFNGDYRIKLTPGRLRNFCEIDPHRGN
jgi:hypothetical protein